MAFGQSNQWDYEVITLSRLPLRSSVTRTQIYGLYHITFPLASIHNHASDPHYNTEESWLVGNLYDESIHFIYLKRGWPRWSLEIKHLIFMAGQVLLEMHSFQYHWHGAEAKSTFSDIRNQKIYNGSIMLISPLKQ